MKKSLLLILIIGTSIGLYYLFNSESEIIDEEDEGIATTYSPIDKTEKKQAKVELKKKTKPVAVDATDKEELSLDQFKEKLSSIIEINKQEIEDCEAKVDQLFGDELDEESENIYSENNIIDILDELETTSLHVQSSGRLLETLSSDFMSKISIEDLGEQIGELRPCRPYKKMSFIHGLMNYYLKNQWSENTKQRVEETIIAHFEKEMSDYTTISNLNMQVALLQAIVSEGMFDKKLEDQIIDFKDQLEDSYDDLLDQADEINENKINDTNSNNPAGFMPLQIIKAEFKISNRFRLDFLKLLNVIKSSRANNY
ncbi:MAG: hypothetical protein HOJ35_13030 [Bdellovibrionales bacterium]|nr:hypothetical protein [Bdellovibrionales bacterium]